jgi:hypothetical protein
VRNGVACRLLVCITQQDVGLGVVLAVGGLAVVVGHRGGGVGGGYAEVGCFGGGACGSKFL